MASDRLDPGVLVGSRVSVGLPDTVLRFALAAILALSGLKLLDVPYSDQLVIASLAAGLAALVVWEHCADSPATRAGSRRAVGLDRDLGHFRPRELLRGNSPWERSSRTFVPERKT